MPTAPKPPGRRLVKRMTSQTKWRILAPISLLLIGYGLCVFSEAANLKHTGQPTGRWVLLGTYSLVVFNTGIALFGQAVRFRIQTDIRRIVRRRLKRHLRESHKKENPVRRA